MSPKTSSIYRVLGSDFHTLSGALYNNAHSKDGPLLMLPTTNDVCFSVSIRFRVLDDCIVPPRTCGFRSAHHTPLRRPALLTRGWYVIAQRARHAFVIVDPHPLPKFPLSTIHGVPLDYSFMVQSTSTQRRIQLFFQLLTHTP